MKWTDVEIAILRTEYEKHTPTKQISDVLGRTERSVRSKASALGIANNKFFTEVEIEYIKRNYNGSNLKQIAQKLGRMDNCNNVCRAARRLGLTNQIQKENQPRSRAKYKSEQERKIAQREALKEWHRNNEHPKGMLGKTHSQVFKEQQSVRLQQRWADPNSSLNSEESKQQRSDAASKNMVERLKKGEQLHTRGKGGTRKDLGLYVRSRWEANIARYLNFLVSKCEIYKWEYEPDTYWFENIKRGTRSYTPDFKIWDKPDSEPYYWEVKGYMDQKSQTKLKRMAKYYPQIKIVVVASNEYKEIKKWSTLIPEWE